MDAKQELDFCQHLYSVSCCHTGAQYTGIQPPRPVTTSPFSKLISLNGFIAA